MTDSDTKPATIVHPSSHSGTNSYVTRNKLMKSAVSTSDFAFFYQDFPSAFFKFNSTSFTYTKIISSEAFDWINPLVS